MNHVDPETLAAWADDALSSEETRALESHLADCSECRAVAAVFGRTLEPPHSREGHPAPRGWILPLAASIVIVAGIAWKYWPQPETPVQIAATAPAPVVAPPVLAPAAPVPEPRDLAPVTPSTRAPKTKAVRPLSAPAEKTIAPAAMPPAPAPVLAPPTITVAPPPIVAPAPPPPAPMPPPATRALNDMASRGAITIQAAQNAGGSESGTGVGAGNGNGVAGGRGGGGGARTVAISSTPPIRWRVTPANAAERSIDNGVTWTAVPLEAAGVQFVSGAAPNASVCWLVGRFGAVFVSKNGEAFKRLPFPEAVDLASVLAIDDLRATVIAADGRSFMTEDGGQTWRIARF